MAEQRLAGSAEAETIPAAPGAAGFLKGTMLETTDGPCPAEHVLPGDTVRNVDGAILQVLWVFRQRLHLDGPDDPFMPIRFAARTLGAGQPRSTLDVAPHHRLRLSCGSLVPARALLSRPGVRVMRGLARVDQVHILLDRPGLILANGAWAQSFCPDPAALDAIPTLARLRLLDLLGGAGPATRR